MDQGEADEPLPKQFTAAFSKSDQETKARLHKLFNTAFYIARENLTFSKFKGKCNLQEKNGRDFGPRTRTIRQAGTLENITAVEKERSQEEIENARFLCVLADGSTE